MTTATERLAATSLDRLFRRACDADEFEYACALLRVRGMEEPGWDPLEETLTLHADLTGLLAVPLRGDTRIRLALLLWCHLLEAKEVHGVVENMLGIVGGDRFHVRPFDHLRRDKIPPSARAVVEHVVRHAREVHEPEVADVLDGIFDDQVRNAFFHSDYTLHDGEFRSRGARFHSGGVVTPALPIDELITLFDRGLGYLGAFMSVYSGHRRAYSADRVVVGRVGPDGQRMSVRLLGDPEQGLRGFEVGAEGAPSTAQVDGRRSNGPCHGLGGP